MAFGRYRAWVAGGFLAVIAAGAVGTAGVLLVPVALGSLVMAALSYFEGSWPLIGRYASGAGVLLTALLCGLFPLPHAPALPGPYAVGTGTFQVSPAGNSAPLVVQVWYPAAAAEEGARLARWLPDAGLASSVLFSRLARAPSRSLTGVPLLEQAGLYPVVFYEHAWMGHRSENVAQIEDLASHGFVVIAVDHPEQSGRVRRADGSVSFGTLPAVPDLSTPEAVDDFEKLAAQCLVQRQWDVRQVREALDRGEVPRLAHRLRLDHLGVFGFSFGGTAALHLCAHDPAFKVGVDEDGFFLGDMQPPGAFLFFDDEMPGWLGSPAASSDTPEQTLIRESEQRIEDALKTPGRERHILQGARHESFTDRIYLSVIPGLARAGKLSAAVIREKVNVPMIGFFKRELAADTLSR